MGFFFFFIHACVHHYTWFIIHLISAFTKFTIIDSWYLYIIYGIYIFLSIDWLKVHLVIKNKLTVLKKLGQSHK